MVKGFSLTIRSNTFGQRADQIDQGTGETVRQVGLLVIAHAAPLTPVDTGRLVGSPRVVDGDGPHAIDVVWTPEYAAAQEARKRFAAQAAEQVAALFVDEVEAVLNP